VRAGGVEQLQAFTRLLDIDLKKANPSDMNNVLKNYMAKKYDQIIIDTPGFNPFDTKDMKECARLVASGDVEPILVLPSGLDAAESGEMARIFSALGVRRLIPSRVDIARRLGGLLAAAHQGGLSFAEFSNTAKVAEGLTPATARILANYFMPVKDKKIPRKISQAAKLTSAKRRTRKTG
jgi:flagellar biosynthesis protein FlhF